MLTLRYQYCFVVPAKYVTIMEVDMKKVSLFSQVAVISSGIFLFLAVLLGVSHAADIAAKYRFQTLSVPDARHTISYGINDLGDVVGVSIDCDFCQPQAFLFSDNQYYDLAVAGASHLTPFGINKAGLIACTLSVGGRQQACLMDDTQTIVLDQAIRRRLCQQPRCSRGLSVHLNFQSACLQVEGRRI